jgi:type II secretory pathway component PulM
MNLDPRPAIATYYARLAPRERILLGLLAVTTLAIGTYSLIWEPMQENRALLEGRIEKAERDLNDIHRTRDEYYRLMRSIEANQASISKEDPNFNLFSYLQNTVTKAVSRDRITSMNPTTQEMNEEFQKELVEIKLSQVNLEQLVAIVYSIEKGEHPLRFSRLQIKKRRDDIYNFDVTATVSLLKAVAPKADT